MIYLVGSDLICSTQALVTEFQNLLKSDEFHLKEWTSSKPKAQLYDSLKFKMHHIRLTQIFSKEF